MSSRLALLLAAVVVVAVAVVALFASQQSTRLAFTLGVTPEDEAIDLSGNRTACQTPIDVPEPFDAIRLFTAHDGGAGPRIEVVVRSEPGGRQLGAGRLDPGYPETASSEVSVGRVPAGGRVSVCVNAPDDGEARIRGGPEQAARTSAVLVDGEPEEQDIALVFLRSEPKTVLGLAPRILDRAALWRPGWIGSVAMAVLVALALLAAPLLLGRAVASAAAEPDGER